MSRANMTQIPDKHGSTCIFQCRDGSTRTYHYNAADSAAIAMGADPKGFSPDGDERTGAIQAVKASVILPNSSVTWSQKPLQTQPSCYNESL